MKKVLLVIEDYNEMLFAETLLKKIGVDSLGVSSDSGIGDEATGFGPDLAIVSDYGPRLKAEPIIKKIKKASGKTSVLMLYKGSDPTEEDILKVDADGAIKSPFHPRQLIDAVAHMTDIDPDGLVKKFEKLSLFKDQKSDSKSFSSGDTVQGENITHVKGSRDETGPSHISGGEASDLDAYDLSSTPKRPAKIFNHMDGARYPAHPIDEVTGSREDRYAEYIKSMEAPEQKVLPKESISRWTKEIRKLGAQEDNTDIDERRRDFVRALYKKS